MNILLSHYLTRCLLLTASYAILGIWMMMYFAPDGGASIVWPCSGLALGALLLGGARYWPGVFAGEFLANLIMTDEWGLSSALGAGNAIGALCGFYAARFTPENGIFSLEHPREFWLLLLAAIVAATTAGLAGHLALWVFGPQPDDWITSLSLWIQGDVIGILVLTPLMLAYGNAPRPKLNHQQKGECLAIIFATAFFAWGILPASADNALTAPYESVVFVLVVWAALRYGLLGALLLICLTVMLALLQQVRLGGPMQSADQQEALGHFWTFAFSLTAVGITLALKVNALMKGEERVQEALGSVENTNHRFNQAQALSHTGCWELNISTGIITWSDEAFRIFEIDQASFSPTYEAFLNVIHPDDKIAVQQAYETSVRNRTTYQITHRLLMPDGRIKWVNEHCITNYDATGQPINSIGTVQDITAHKQVEDATLVINEARLRAIFETVKDVIVIINTEGIIELTNPACEKMFGYTVDEMVGKNISMLMPAEVALHHDGYLAKFQRHNESTLIGVGRELCGRSKQGNDIPIEICVTRALLDEHFALVGVIRDISARKEYETALMEAKTQAEAANLAKSQFLATMTHELRTPLNSVLGMVQLVQMEEITERQRGCLMSAQRAGEHLLAMINSILDYTKLEVDKLTLNLTEMDLHELLRNVVAFMQPYLEDKPIALNLAIDDNVPRTIRADALRLKQVLINLVQNAIKFTSAGAVNVAVSDVALDNGKCLLHFAIHDTGIGIDTKDHTQLFKPFSQIDNSKTRRFSGTGLGLAICRQLVELMGGEIGVESELGKGSTFWFDIPCHPVQKSDAEDHQMPAVANVLPGMRIVLLEANIPQQKLVSRLLLGRGAMVSTANRREDFSRLLERADYQIVIVGLPLPDNDLDKVLTEIASLQKNASTLLLLPDDMNNTPAAMHSPASQTLVKPVKPEALLQSVMQLLSKKQSTP